MKTSYALMCIILAALIIGGCGRPRESQIESAIERELPRVIGPAESYSVDVQGIRDSSGADRVIANGRRVQPAGSPVLDRVNITLTDVVYNASRQELERVGQADGTVRVLSGDIASFLENNRNLEDVEVQLQSPNQVIVRARSSIAQLGNTEVETTGTLRVDGPRINYDISRVRAGGVTLPSPAPRLLSDEINPIVDLSSMPIVMQVTSIRVESNAVIASVTGKYPP